MSAVLEAAAVGHRITHSGPAAPLQVEAPASLGKLLSQNTTSPVLNGLTSLQLTGVSQVGPTLTLSGSSEACPSPQGAIPDGSKTTFLGPQKAPAALLRSDLVIPCDKHGDGPMVTGAATVMVDGVPLARRTDQVDCGAVVGEGDPTILVGGPPAGAPTPHKPQLDEGTAGALVGLGGVSTTPSLNAEVGQMLGKGLGLGNTSQTTVPNGGTVGSNIAQNTLGKAIVPLFQ